MVTKEVFVLAAGKVDIMVTGEVDVLGTGAVDVMVTWEVNILWSSGMEKPVIVAPGAEDLDIWPTGMDIVVTREGVIIVTS